jgi:hypothetical protein
LQGQIDWHGKVSRPDSTGVWGLGNLQLSASTDPTRPPSVLCTKYTFLCQHRHTLHSRCNIKLHNEQAIGHSRQMRKSNEIYNKTPNSWSIELVELFPNTCWSSSPNCIEALRLMSSQMKCTSASLDRQASKLEQSF